MISKRAQKLLDNPSAIMTGHAACAADPYASDNPDGYLNFGIAENRLVDDLALEVLNRAPALKAEHVHYGPLEGLPELREAFAGFAAKFLNAPEVVPSKVVVQTGLSSMCESMAFALFDACDEIIVPSPYYTGFKVDFDGRFEVKLVGAPLSPERDPDKDIAALRKAITTRTKAVLLTNPNNPSGEVLSREFLEQVAKLCREKNLRLISDEIYALSIHDRRRHVSILEVEPEYEDVHLLYGMAKDFGMAGIKTGFYYSRDEASLGAVKAASYFHPVATSAQAQVAQFLSDHQAVENFVDESNRRVKEALDLLLELAPNIKTVRPAAGMFFLADFSHMLESFQSEAKLFEYFLNRLKVNMTPGREMGMEEEGFFRVCYARPLEQVRAFAKRLNAV